MKKRCSVYVRNSISGPSDYYRVIQYIEKLGDIAEFQIFDALNNKDFQKNLRFKPGLMKKVYQAFLFVKIVINRFRAIRKDLKHKPDVIIVQREIFPRYMPLFFRQKVIYLLSSSTVIWDYDDDIFLNGEISGRERKILCTYSNSIVGIGEYARSLLPPQYRDKFVMLPTTDCMFSTEEVEMLKASRKKNYSKEIRIVWVGTPSTMKFLDIIADELDAAAFELEKIGKKVVLSVVCNISYKRKVKTLRIENIPWSRERTKQEIGKAHIGIMPLADIPYAKGKGGFKLIQYLSSGIPVISSDIGFCKEVVGDCCGYLVSAEELGDWSSNIRKLGNDEDLWAAMCEGAYSRYLEKFSFENNLQVWEKLVSAEDIWKSVKKVSDGGCADGSGYKKMAGTCKR